MGIIIIEVKYGKTIVAKKKFRNAELATKWLLTADCTDSYNMAKNEVRK